MTFAARHRRFHNLHPSGCFVIPNPWVRINDMLIAGAGGHGEQDA